MRKAIVQQFKRPNGVLGRLLGARLGPLLVG
jgi:hypothetical protein